MREQKAGSVVSELTARSYFWARVAQGLAHGRKDSGGRLVALGLPPRAGDCTQEPRG